MKVAEIVGAKSELWTRFLPSAISDWSHADQSEYEPPSNIREIVETWLETSKETILRLLPAKLKCTTRGEDLSSLRTSLETSIAPSSRDATQERFILIFDQGSTGQIRADHKMNPSKLGEWMIVVNSVFERNIDFRKFFFDEPFNSRLCEIISFDLDEINKNTKSLLRKAVEETLRDPNFDFSISSSIWTQRDESDQNVDWAKKNLR